MAFFQLRDPTGRVWPPLTHPKYATLWSAYLGLEESQWWDRAQLEGAQLAQLRALLAHCRQFVPYYRTTFAAIDPATIQTLADLRRLPLLDRATYQQRFPEMVAQNLPVGMGQTNINHTSGSRGIPVEVRSTNVVTLLWWACYLRDLHWGQIDPRLNLCALRPLAKPGQPPDDVLRGLSMPYWQRELHEMIETGPSHGMELSQDIRVQLAWVRQHNPDYLLSFPSNLLALAALMEQDGVRLPRLKKVQTIGEGLGPESQRHIEAVFGAPVHNTYSCVEAGYVASPCPTGEGLHVHAENVLVEVLTEEGHPCAPGETGKVVLTTLQNYLTPFLRYDIGDEATLGPAHCSCGRGLPLLTRVHGKRRPLFLLPNGRRKNSWWLVAHVRDNAGVRQWQLVQERRDRLVIRLVPTTRWDTATETKLRQDVTAFFEAPMETVIEFYERIPVPTGGKLLDVICNV